MIVPSGRATELARALSEIRGYATEIERDAASSLQSLRASLIQEIIDRLTGAYPPAPPSAPTEA